jgi:hypothetical protein
MRVKLPLGEAAEHLCPQPDNKLTSAYKPHKAYMACKAHMHILDDFRLLGRGWRGKAYMAGPPSYMRL